MENIGGINKETAYQPSVGATKETEIPDSSFSDVIAGMEIVKKEQEVSDVPAVGEGEAALSSEAQSYLADLKVRFPNFHFEIKDSYTPEDVRQMAKSMESDLGCIMNTALIEQMATDESVRAEYEAMLSKAEEDFNTLKDFFIQYENENGAGIFDKWSFLIEEMNGEFTYNVIDDREEILKSSSIEELLEKLRSYLEQIKEQDEESSEIYSSIVFDM